MKTVRSALAALAVAAGLLAAPAEATPFELVRLEGSRSGWVEVTIPGTRTYSVQDVRIETRGRFAGYYAEQLTSAAGEQWAGSRAGVLSLRDLGVPGKRPRQVLLGPPQLSAGRVRFYLLADRPTTVRITAGSPPEGAPLPVVRPRRFVTPRVASGALRPDGDRWAGTLGVTLPDGALTVAGMLAYGDLLDTAEARVCVAEHCDQRDPVDDRVRGIGQTGDPDAFRVADPSRLWSVAYGPGALSAGRRAARFSLAGPAGGVRGGVVAVFTLPLG